MIHVNFVCLFRGLLSDMYDVNCMYEQRFLATLRLKYLACSAYQKTLTDACEYKRLCKHKNIISLSVQVTRKTSRMLIYLSLLSCLHDNHVKQLRECSHNITILAHLLYYCLCIK
jgi:hypothetical protein